MNGMLGSINRVRVFSFLGLATMLGCFGGCGDDSSGKSKAAVNVTPTTGLTTTEAGGQTFFTVSLGARPSADVTIALSTNDPTEGTVSPATLTFTKDNYNGAQVVTVTGVDDAQADGNVAYAIVLAPATSTDKKYNGMDPADVAVANVDNETAGITVTPVAGLRTTEAGGAATFTVVLNSQPTGDVTIPVASSDPTEGLAAPVALVFTPVNYAAPQMVTVTGVDDTEADGEVAYTVVLGATTSVDPAYNALDPADVALGNVDNDTAGVSVEPTTGLVTSETGTTATFQVRLNTQPSADVTIPLASSDVGEVTVEPAALVFTALNWNAPQAVTVKGVEDDVADGSQPFTINVGPATSADLGYNTFNPADATGVNTDNDSPGFVFAPLVALTTTEAGGQATFTVALQSKPSAAVTITLVSNKPTEGTVSPASLTFSTDDWNAPKPVTVTGVDDQAADGNQVYAVVTGAATSADLGYNGVDPVDVPVTNTDNDTPAIVVNAASNLGTTEAGGTATFTVSLQTQPAANVTIAVSSDDATEGTVSPAQLIFTPTDWSGIKTVTITGVNDDIADGNQTYKVILAAAVSPDAAYNTLDAADVTVSNTDNDSPGVTVSPTGGLVTTESGGQATFSLVLRSRPSADVTFPISSSDTTEGTVSSGSVTFTPDSWNSARTITVTGINDDLADGNQPYTIVIGTATSEDPTYRLNPDDVTVSNTDNDSAGFAITPTETLVTTERGGKASFVIKLTSRPAEGTTVTVNFTSSDTTEGTVSPASFVFNPNNWNAENRVEITGVPDQLFDGDQVYTIVTSEAVSTDPNYTGKNPPDVRVVNEDADPGVVVVPVAGLTTTELGGTATFRVWLNTAPAGDVSITLASSDQGEGEIDKTQLVFTPVTWESPQTVTVTGQDDEFADGPQEFTIVTSLTSSATDPAYNNLVVDDVKVTNIDDETEGVNVGPISGNTREDGTTAKFTVVLNSRPTQDVEIGLESSNPAEGTVDKAKLTFTSANWNAPQTVTVTGQNDNVADGPQSYTIRLLTAVSGDAKYAVIDPADVTVVNVDDETAGVTVSPTVLVTNEQRTLAPQFSVVLDSEPRDVVTIAVQSSNTAEGTVNKSSLVFTPENWATRQFVTVQGVDDPIQDGDRSYSIVLSPATSTDPQYANRDPADVVVTNIDNDTANILVLANSGLQTTEAGGIAKFEIVLQTQPTANVTIPLRSGDITEGIVTPASLVFTADNWNGPQEVTITGVNDEEADGDQVFDVITDPATSTDANYNQKNAANVSITNKDDETAGFIVTAPEEGLVTDESGKQDKFTIRLTSRPVADVTVTLSVDNDEATVSPTTLTFNSINWKGEQEVTVTGRDDFVKDGNATYRVITSAAESGDSKYDDVNPQDVLGTNGDNDSASVRVVLDQAISVTEDGSQTATFYLVLTSQPKGNVTVPNIRVSDASAATLSVSSIQITPQDWDGRKFITVTGKNDFVADGKQPFLIEFGALVSPDDADYAGLTVDPVPGETLDDESAGVLVTPRTGLVTNENGAVATFKVRLLSEPKAPVTVSFAAAQGDELKAIAPIVFTPNGPNAWNVEKTVSVQGTDDDVADGNRSFQITVSSTSATDPEYNDKTWGTVTGTNNDDETPNFTVSRRRGLVTTESGGQDSFTVVLDSQPKQEVVITLTANPEEGSLDKTSLTFNAMNWKDPQTVTVTGVDDQVSDGNQSYFIVLSPASSSDPDYKVLPSQSVEVTNSSNE